MEELVKKAKKGNSQAFDELIKAYQKELYLIAKTRLQNDDDIADAIQDTIILCYKNINKLKDNSLFKSWLIKILINECKKTYKKHPLKTLSIDDDNFENYLGTCENYEQNLSFDILIKGLKKDEQLLLTLFYVSRYTTKEISKIVKMNENTVRTNIFRAKNKIKGGILRSEGN